MPRTGARGCDPDQGPEHKHGNDCQLSSKVHWYRYLTYRRRSAGLKTGRPGPGPYLAMESNC